MHNGRKYSGFCLITIRYYPSLYTKPLSSWKMELRDLQMQFLTPVCVWPSGYPRIYGLFAQVPIKGVRKKQMIGSLSQSTDRPAPSSSSSCTCFHGCGGSQESNGRKSGWSTRSFSNLF